MKIALILIIGASALLGAPVTNRVPEWAVETFTGTNLSLLQPYGELYIGAMPYGPTNIVISNSYTGTIQIGTNFWTVSEITNPPPAFLCSVRGHVWGDHLHVTLEYVPSRIGCRECKVCGLHQSQYASEWK